MAIFTGLLSLAGITSLSTFLGTVGTCLLATNTEEFDMGEYSDRH